MPDSTPSAPSQADESAVPEKLLRIHAYLILCRETLLTILAPFREGAPMDDLARIQERKLRRIEAALDRIRRGVFDVCDVCGEEIPVARLFAVMTATTCIDCRKELDQLLTHHNGESSSS